MVKRTERNFQGVKVLGSCKSGGKGGASAGRTGGAITTGTSDLDYTKVGVSFSKLDRQYQDQINNALKMSEAMQKDIAELYGVSKQTINNIVHFRTYIR